MYIALMSHDNKKELMVQFCSAYAGILSRHNLCATSTTGRMITEATGVPVENMMMSASHTHSAPDYGAGNVAGVGNALQTLKKEK